MLCSGCGSATTGRSNAVDSSWLTSGIRDEPPASSTASSSSGADPGRPQRPVHRRHRVPQRRRDHRFQFGAVQPDPGVHAGQRHRDHHLGVEGQRLLGLHAVAAQPGQGRDHLRRRRGPGRRSRRRGPRARAPNTASSKSTPPSCSMPSGSPSSSKPVAVAAQHRRVEGAAAEVVDGDRLARGDLAGGGVLQGRRLRLGAQQHRARCRPAAAPGRAARACTAPSWPGGSRSAPRGGPSCSRVTVSITWRSSLAVSACAENGTPPTRIGTGSPMRRLNSRASRPGLGQAAALGGLADEQVAVGFHEDQRRDLGAPAAEAHDLDAAVDPDGRRRLGGAEIDPQAVLHSHSSRP